MEFGVPRDLATSGLHQGASGIFTTATASGTLAVPTEVTGLATGPLERALRAGILAASPLRGKALLEGKQAIRDIL